MKGRRVNHRWLLVWSAIPVLTSGTAWGDEPGSPRRLQPAMPASSVPVEQPAFLALRPGATVTVRIRQVFPRDGFSPGERLLNGCQEVLPGDRFLAEVINPPSGRTPLVGGTVVKVDPPGKFGRAGRLTLQMAQLVETRDGTPRTIPWEFDTEDRRRQVRRERHLLTTLFALEGAMFGGSIAGEVARRSPVFIASGAAAGVILGLGYASLRGGVEASLEQGDTFEVVVGTTAYRPIPRNVWTKIYPAPDPAQRKGKKKDQP